MALRTTLGELLHDCAERYAQRPFLTIAPSGETWTYAAFEQLVNRFAHGLLAVTGRPPSHVAIMLENGVDYLAASYALKKIGSVEVSVNRAFRGPALARTINLTGTPYLITSGAHAEALAGIRDELTALRTLIVTDGEAAVRAAFPALEVLRFEALLAERDDHIRNLASDLTPAAIMFTSGTTGVSKGCQLSHRYAIRTAENVVPPFRVTGADAVYSPYPLAHIGPAYYDGLTAMITGGRLILRDGFSLSNFWPEICEFGATWFMMLGSVQQLLWSAPERPEERMHKVSRCWATPAPVPKAQFDARFNTHLIPGGGYGSTDAGWVVVPQWDHPGGIVLPEFEVAIVDDNDDPVPPGTPGELLVRSREPGIISDEYFGMPEATLASRRNLWFHTGDIARFDEAGLFYFVCRKAERIRVRGEMVSAFEVEEGVLAHPDIEDCAAIGVPSPLGEEEIKVFIVPRPGRALTADAVQAHCATRMAKYMVPAQTVFLSEIPRTPTGKPEKGKLAAM
ncbi:AMP-binding protein [Paralimibaculum aggregatum]|uniref:AMP-binding protein n=1 Tax=Paralimibaculum aggregatum TaxID=3036245 RepID=A0ABQ6LDT0_9RHOB|nr:AMP-binding protein [Limibaculum sp. NKW23]GMG81513.1 AMP-binding protein [Limibaculum sp. NKW23]